ncbi:MAG TPA: WYL domain-containing protein [Longimicrobiales bacterium]|nr:WYL domain-containing protein [Longimicrobiales bacterium]
MPPPERTTAEAQLERILYILPAAAREGGADIDELARALGVQATVVLRDLEEATARTFHHPGGATETFTIYVEGRRVRVHAPTEFRRPVRLNAREMLAVGLGLRTLAAEADEEERSRLLELASRLEAELAAPDYAVRVEAPSPGDEHLSLSRVPAPALDRDADVIPIRRRRERVPDNVEYDDDARFMLAFDDDGFRGVVADAIELGRICSLWYLKAGELTPSRRLIAPWRLIYAEGMWYVAAHDVERDGLRFFRMDRILDASLESGSVPEAPAGLDAMLAQGAPFIASDEVEVGVRYSPRIARWITERTECEAEEDGSVVVRHRVADPRWLVRHVLQYAGDAVVEEPPAARTWVADAAARMAAGA